MLQAIVTNDRNLQYAENRCVALAAELENLNKLEKQEADTIATLDKVMEVVEKLVAGSENHTLSLQEAFQTFRELQVTCLFIGERTSMQMQTLCYYGT